ncbi:peptidyl-prolyl cis-trans isomerase [Patellaria atrata CBS 101060]|uniref:peptidylprolyl isomerase n=1 Tax=Patellaria atrata CBS 101060 TaxID=1346257 RepID=A0A9P4VK74_9PEZI|nr:peptidyl-prolyl cis-trans isomerase [Patellaria atrata CBS 101060]
MGVEKEIIQQGNGDATAKHGDKVIYDYTGWLYDPSQDDKKGTQISTGTSTFIIGQGGAIRGLDEGILGMAVDEEALLVISPDYAYSR